MNTVCLMGRTTANIEKTEARSGTALARFTLAVDRRGKDGGTDFIRCVAFGKTAETLATYIDKGRRIGITGRIQTGDYTDKDGRKVYTTDVIVDSFDFADSRQEAAQAQAQRAPENPGPIPGFFEVPDGIDEGVPFT